MFLNMACVLDTALAPDELMRRLLAIELALGRDRSSQPQQGPRTLDLDLLLAENEDGPVVHSSAVLALPHPRLKNRRFALVPLCEIAPQAVHPTTGDTVAAMLEALERDVAGRVELLGALA